jgi:LacI family transcriptional regulator
MQVRQRRATQKDVAERAGVSQVAVSAVLGTGFATARVSEETRQRILDAARDLSYRPNAIARSLRSRRTDIIGFYTDHLITTLQPFTAQLIGGLQEGCDEHRLDLLLHGSFHGKSSDAIYDELLDGKIDGLIVWGGTEAPLIDRIAASHLPAVAVGDPVVGLPSVLVDDAGGGALIARRLIERGHRRVLYRHDPRGLVSVERRLRGFLAEAGDALEVTVTRPSWWNGPLEASEVELLTGDAPDRPTAVVGWNDDAAVATLRWAEERGIPVPERLAVVGFNGLDTGVNGYYGLTAVVAPWSASAKAAVARLVALLAGDDTPDETILPVALNQGRTA